MVVHPLFSFHYVGRKSENVIRKVITADVSCNVGRALQVTRNQLATFSTFSRFKFVRFLPYLSNLNYNAFKTRLLICDVSRKKINEIEFFYICVCDELYTYIYVCLV